MMTALEGRNREGSRDDSRKRIRATSRFGLMKQDSKIVGS